MAISCGVEANKAFAKLFKCLTFNIISIYVWESCSPPRVLCGLTWMILLKVSGLLPNLEVYGERLTLVDLASLSIVLMPVFIEMATISKWCLVHLWGAKYQPIDTCVMMALLFLAPVYAEFAMWIWSVTSPLLYVFLPPFIFLSHLRMSTCPHAHILIKCIHIRLCICVFFYFFFLGPIHVSCKYDLVLRFLFSGP